MVSPSTVSAIAHSTEMFSLCLRRPIVAFNPRARGATEADAAKLHHLRVVAETVGCGVEECMLVDDMPGAQVASAASLVLVGLAQKPN